MRIHLRLHNSEPLKKLSEGSELEQTLIASYMRDSLHSVSKRDRSILFNPFNRLGN